MKQQNEKKNTGIKANGKVREANESVETLGRVLIAIRKQDSSKAK